MEYTFFLISVAVAWVLLAVSVYFKPLNVGNIIIGIATVAYSLVYDTLFGAISGLYYYISPQESALYMVLSSILIYPAANIIYTLFLPRKRKAVLVYTGLWIAFMLLFERASLLSRTIVFTGWRPVPWSFITYIITYGWVYFFYRYLTARGFGSDSVRRMYRH